MAKYLVEASYTREGVAGVQAKGGSDRRDAIAAMAQGLGGQMESLYFAFGEHDVYVVVDLPGNEAAAAVALAVNAAGGATVKTTVLLTPEQVDEAAKRSVDLPATRKLTGAHAGRLRRFDAPETPGYASADQVNAPPVTSGPRRIPIVASLALRAEEHRPVGMARPGRA